MSAVLQAAAPTLAATPQVELFSDSYAQARRRFLAACARRGAQVQSQRHPSRRDDNGEPLAIDVAWLGPDDADTVLLLIVGTHGYEAYAGAACVLQGLQAGGLDQLPPDTAVAIVHGLNPYGWAHASRFNEDFVDLNRNFIDFAALPAPNPVYPAVHALLDVDASTGLEQGLKAVFAHLAEAQDKPAVMQAVTGGQYTHPDGLNFGGQRLSWSNQCLRDFAARKLAHRRSVVIIDHHTGLGPHGQPFMVCLHAPGSAAQARAHALWGRERLTHEAFYDTGEAAAEYRGLVITGLEQQLVAARVAVTGMVVEWGTYSNEQVLAALLIDRWLRFGGRDAPEAVRSALAGKMLEAFYPASLDWRRSVLEHNRALVAETLERM